MAVLRTLCFLLVVFGLMADVAYAQAESDDAAGGAKMKAEDTVSGGGGGVSKTAEIGGGGALTG